MRRCFIALALPISTRERLARAQRALADCALRNDLTMQLTRPENLHLTLKFLGATTETELGALEGVVHEVAGAQLAFAASLAGLGAFPARGEARAIFAQVATGSAELAALAAALERATVALGFTAETRPRIPHVTLARVRKPRACAALASLIATWPLDALGEVDTARLVLYETVPASAGSLYVPLVSARIGSNDGAAR